VLGYSFHSFLTLVYWLLLQQKIYQNEDDLGLVSFFFGYDPGKENKVMVIAYGV
jgi:hypothetical protein